MGSCQHLNADVYTRQTAEPGLQKAACGKHDRWPLAALLFVHLPVWGWFSLAHHYIKVNILSAPWNQAYSQKWKYDKWSLEPQTEPQLVEVQYGSQAPSKVILETQQRGMSATWVFCKWSAGWTAGRQWAPGSRREGLRPASAVEISPDRVFANSLGTGGSWWQSH